MGQNPKIWLLWRPVAPQPYLLEKSWPISETPWPCTTTWSKQYLSAVHPVTCSLLWVRHLFDRFSISDFGGKWPIKWKFSKMSFRIPQQDTDIRFVTTFGENRSLRSCRKSLWITAQKKTWAPWDSSQPPLCPKCADRVQTSPDVVTPWHVHVYRIWSGSAALCPTYSENIDFSAPKVITIGFEPTIKSIIYLFYFC